MKNISLLLIFVSFFSFSQENQTVYISSESIWIKPSFENYSYLNFFSVKRTNNSTDMFNFDTFRFYLSTNPILNKLESLNDLAVEFETKEGLPIKDINDFSKNDVCENYNLFSDNKVIITKEISRAKGLIKYKFWYVIFEGCLKNVSIMGGRKFETELTGSPRKID